MSDRRVAALGTNDRQNGNQRHGRIYFTHRPHASVAEQLCKYIVLLFFEGALVRRAAPHTPLRRGRLGRGGRRDPLHVQRAAAEHPRRGRERSLWGRG